MEEKKGKPPGSPIPEHRESHFTVADGGCLYLWGGFRTIENNEVYLPSDEVWLYEIDTGLWQMCLMDGEVPSPMSGSCGACVNGVLYIFGGYDDIGYSNQLYCVNLRTKNSIYTWKKVKNFKGQPPTPRDKLSCWVYKDRLIFFGGYGCRKHSELNDFFDVHDATWEGQTFWGWNNDIFVFDTVKKTWFQPAAKGVPPQPRAAHTCAVMGNKGYVFGGRVLQSRKNDLHYLDLDTWSWSGEIKVNGEKPAGRSWHTCTTIADDQLFLFGGLSTESEPLTGDGWIFSVKSNEWTQLKHLPKDKPRLWHTACFGKENEVMVFGGSKDDLLYLDTGHCNDLLIFQTQPYSLARLCLDCIGKNAASLQSQLSWLPSRLLQEVMKKITFWAAVRHREKAGNYTLYSEEEDKK
nr:PREDICTED: kelch domain-containing protein 1 isoform X1 [Latimeria chalumnae]|eukprot:XP_014343296.1 PREDICTED: kelch domain-containing protein 1 isoform X1 [Latimeria chalumnae]